MLAGSTVREVSWIGLGVVQLRSMKHIQTKTTKVLLSRLSRNVERKSCTSYIFAESVERKCREFFINDLCTLSSWSASGVSEISFGSEQPGRECG